MKDIVPQYHRRVAQRTPCMLVLDASGSMNEVIPSTGRKRIEELNHGLKMLRDDLVRDPVAAERVQLAIVCVGGPAGHADLLMDWTDAIQFQAPQLYADGLTPMGEGLRIALQCVDQQKRTLKAQGINFTRPWIMVISDGEPSDEAKVWEAAAAECRAAEIAKKCVIYPFGVADARLDTLQEISATPARRLGEAQFREYFKWLSSSLSTLSRAPSGSALQDAAISPWGVVGPYGEAR